MNKILLIDDDKRTVSALIEDLVETYKFQVTCLTNADEVLLELNEVKYDAIILDVMMPVPVSWTINEKSEAALGLATGVVLYKKIRKIFSTIPILILSAREFIDIKSDKFSLYIRKPESIAGIVKNINKLLKNEQ